jgi:hypothetical protein
MAALSFAPLAVQKRIDRWRRAGLTPTQIQERHTATLVQASRASDRAKKRYVAKREADWKKIPKKYRVQTAEMLGTLPPLLDDQVNYFPDLAFKIASAIWAARLKQGRS